MRFLGKVSLELRLRSSILCGGRDEREELLLELWLWDDRLLPGRPEGREAAFFEGEEGLSPLLRFPITLLFRFSIGTSQLLIKYVFLFMTVLLYHNREK